MAWRCTPDGADPDTYRGLPSLFGFINQDGALQRWNCGQAAACTVMHFHRSPDDPDPETVSRMMAVVEQLHPPNIAFGWFGTSRRRVERILRTNGIDFEEVTTEEAVKAALADHRPVIFMLAMEGPKVLGLMVPMGHWVVAYGYDDTRVFLTNWGVSIPWPEFRRRWLGFTPRLISMRSVGLAMSKKASI